MYQKYDDVELTDTQKLFPQLEPLQKYDAVLEALFKISGDAPTFDDINKWLLLNNKQVHWGEVMDILYTMGNDGYVYGHMTHPKKGQMFLLSFNGKLLQQ